MYYRTCVCVVCTQVRANCSPILAEILNNAPIRVAEQCGPEIRMSASLTDKKRNVGVALICLNSGSAPRVIAVKQWPLASMGREFMPIKMTTSWCW